MKRAWGCFAAAAMASALMACPLKRPGAADGHDDAATEASVAVAEAGAAEAFNAAEMARYPDEKPFDHAPITAAENGNMRTQAGAGDLVMVLKKGAEVAKLAEHGRDYLVVADDPKDPTRKLMGWIAESTFATDEAPRHAAASDWGAKPSATDGGGKAPKDGGAKLGAPDVAPKSGPLRLFDIPKNADGSCAADYAPCSALCRLKCKAPSDCGPLPLVTCTGGFCTAPGAQPCK